MGLDQNLVVELLRNQQEMSRTSSHASMVNRMEREERAREEERAEKLAKQAEEAAIEHGEMGKGRMRGSWRMASIFGGACTVVGSH